MSNYLQSKLGNTYGQFTFISFDNDAKTVILHCKICNQERTFKKSVIETLVSGLNISCPCKQENKTKATFLGEVVKSFLVVSLIYKNRYVLECIYCKKQQTASKTSLLKKSIHSCSCPDYWKFENLKESSLKIISFPKGEEISAKHLIEVECPYCLSHFSTSIYNISRQIIKSCGCLNSLNRKKNKLNLSEFSLRTFGKLKIIESDYKVLNVKSHNGQVHHVKRWKVLCECGNIKYYSYTRFCRSDYPTHCGCESK